MLSGLLLMVQAAILDGQLLDLLSPFDDGQDGLLDLLTVLEGSCAPLLHNSVFEITDPRTFFFPILEGS